MHKIEKDWVSNGLRCVVIMSQMGHRCGYVGVPIEHPLFALRYQDRIPVEFISLWRKVKRGPIGKRGIMSLFCFDKKKPAIEYLFDVHGSITYSSGGLLSDYPVESNLWWFGYDCAHAGDGIDLSVIKNPELREMYIKFPVHGDVIRSLSYCISECESLARQLMDYEGAKL